MSNTDPIKHQGLNSAKQFLLQMLDHHVTQGTDQSPVYVVDNVKTMERVYDSANRPRAVCQIRRWTMRVVIYKFRMVTVTLIKMYYLTY